MTDSNFFTLTENFIDKYKSRTPPFGFGGASQFVYYTKYSRKKEDGTKESWWETVRRVVEGTYSLQQEYIESQNLGWNAWQAQKSAQQMYDRMYNFKLLPGGRGLWGMGTRIITEKKLFMALHNCSFRSSEDLKENPSGVFRFIMDISMLGGGSGFDIRGANKLLIRGPDRRRKKEVLVITDDREGWVESTGSLIESYAHATAQIEFDYSQIRKKGEPLVVFGGVSSGSKPLKDCHNKIREILDGYVGTELDAKGIVDIGNLIGRCVVSGNIRRTASIVLGSPYDEDYLNLKNYKMNPDRKSWGWISNNSVLAELGMDYSDIVERILNNGEPGLVWLENCKNYSRFIDPPDYKDALVAGVNPCGEMTLEDGEACNLAELYLNNHEDKEDFLRSIKFAYLYAKTVTLGKVHIVEANRVMLRNRRIGCSDSGIAQFIAKYGIGKLTEWLDDGYKRIQYWDEMYSNWLCIPKSIKTTTVKPSGNTSILAGATHGVHYPPSRYYIRRFRLDSDDVIIERLKDAGYKIEPADEDPEGTVVVEFPIDVGESLVTNGEISMWEQLSLASLMQKYWSDNAVSCTVTFNPDKVTKNELVRALDFYQYQLKGITFLPQKEISDYKQMPQEGITEEEYKKMVSGLKPIDYSGLKFDVVGDQYCDSDTCEIK